MRLTWPGLNTMIIAHQAPPSSTVHKARQIIRGQHFEKFEAVRVEVVDGSWEWEQEAGQRK